MLPPAADYSDTGVVLPVKIVFAEWVRLGQNFCAAANTLQWFVGDWAAFGQTRFAPDTSLRTEKELLDEPDRDCGHLERFAQANHLEYGTLRNYAWVSRRLAHATRVASLSWTHHRAVASLPLREQRKWLTIAQAQTLSVADLRARIRADQITESEDESTPIKLPDTMPPMQLLAWLKAQPEDWWSPAVREHWRETLRPLAEFWQTL